MIPTRSRVLLGAALLLVGGVCVCLAFCLDSQQTLGGLLLNLATEFLGIVVTFTILDWILSQHELGAQARAISNAAARDLDRVVWYWLGGSYLFDLDLRVAQLSQIGGVGAEFTDEVRRELAQLASKASHTRRAQRSVLKKNAVLDRALSRLESMINHDYVLDNSETLIATNLIEGATAYAKILGIPLSQLRRIVGSDSSPQSQLLRIGRRRM